MAPRGAERSARDRHAICRGQQLVAVERWRSRHFENAPKRMPDTVQRVLRQCEHFAPWTMHFALEFLFEAEPRILPGAPVMHAPGIGGSTIAGCRTSFAIIWISARGEATRRRLAIPAFSRA